MKADMSDKAIVSPDELEIEPLDQAEIEQRTPDWYATWRERIRQWIADHAADDLAEIVLLVPDLLVLLLRLARDPRVPWTLKGQLLLAAAYVISPVDLMPEALLGVIGLTDDAGVLALVLMWLKGVTSVDQQVLREQLVRARRRDHRDRHAQHEDHRKRGSAVQRKSLA